MLLYRKDLLLLNHHLSPKITSTCKPTSALPWFNWLCIKTTKKIKKQKTKCISFKRHVKLCWKKEILLKWIRGSFEFIFCKADVLLVFLSQRYTVESLCRIWYHPCDAWFTEHFFLFLNLFIKCSKPHIYTQEHTHMPENRKYQPSCWSHAKNQSYWWT